MRRPTGRIPFAIVTVAILTCWCLPPAITAEREPQFDQRWSPTQSVTMKIPKKVIAPADADGPKGSKHGGDGIGITSNFCWNQILVDVGLPAEKANGSARKQALQTIPIEGAVSGLAVADFNQDGFDDIAAADFLSGRVDIFRGDGTGRFRKGPSAQVGTWPIRLESGDYNGDGIADIATANLYDSSITKLYGAGDGRFVRPETRKVTAAVASALFTLRQSAAVDYTAIKQAVSSTDMSSSTRSKLQKCLTQSENAYNAGNRRKAIRGLEKFIKQLNKNRDSQLSEKDRRELIDLAKDLIQEILESREVTATITADPSVIAPGGSSTLTWSTAGAVSATIDNGIGSVSTSGSKVVTPAGTTTYTLLATAASGATASASATVYVGAANMMYVDAARGSDSTGNGTYANPYQSITKGLAVAGSSAARESAAAAMNVSAAAGYYDSDIEKFPLAIPAGVGVYGAGSTKTQVVGGAVGADGFHCGISMGEGSTLSGVKVRNLAGFGVWVNSVAATITNCDISSCGYDGIEVLGSANLTLTGSSVTNNYWDGVWFQDTAGGALTGNTLSANGLRGLALYYSSGAVAVSGNTLSANASMNTFAYYSSGLSMTQNTFGDMRGVYLNGDAGSSVSNNVFNDSTGAFYAVRTRWSTSVISGNTIGGAYDYGIYSTFADTSSLNGNGIGALLIGVNTYNSSAATVAANTFSGCGTGILTDGWSLATLSGNSISGCSTGVQAGSSYGPGYPTVRSNTITGCSSQGALNYWGYGDFGTLAQSGNNTFHNLAAGADANLENQDFGVIDAYGNTWDNAPPTTGFGGDIYENPGTVNY